MERMDGTYLLLGTNLGNREENLKTALHKVEHVFGEILKFSSLYETAAWGKTDQPSFLNMVILVYHDLSPQETLHALQGIEKSMGRIRIEKWSERIIDIDILYMGQLIIDQPDLKVPHPEISNRRFTLAPLAEISPDFLHPVLRETQQELLQYCPDTLPVRKIDWPV